MSRSWAHDRRITKKKQSGNTIVTAGWQVAGQKTRSILDKGNAFGEVIYRANPDNRLGSYPCLRDEKATEMLSRLQGESDLTIAALRSIVDAVHMQGPGINTLYSNLMDLRWGIVYLYYWHQYGEMVTLDVAKELAEATKPTPLRDLFARATVEQAESERRNYAGRSH